MEWRDRLAQEFARVEAAGDTVVRVELRTDVYKAAEGFGDIGLEGPVLWGAKLTCVEDLGVPFRAHGVSGGRDAFVAKAQRKWLDETYAKLISQGDEVTRITVESVTGDGISVVLTGEWS